MVLDLATTQSKHPELHIEILFCKQEGEYLDKFREAGINCHFLQLNSGYDVSPWKYLRALRIFRGHDILHFHHFNPLLMLCGVISGKWMIYTAHGFPGRQKMKWTDHMEVFFLKKILNSYVAYITFNSQFTKQRVEKLYGLDAVRRSVVYNGISFEKEPQTFTGIEESILQKTRGKFIIGTTSRFVGFKRIDRLIQAFSDFQKNKDSVLLLVGDGPLRNELEQLIKQLRLTDKSIVTGFRPNVQEFQGMMDVCVFPSENEPFGLVAVEALSLGKPVIVLKDGGGITEVVGGFSKDDVVEDLPHLVHRLEYYYNNKNEMHLSQDRINYAEKFNIDNMVTQFTAIYKEVTQKAG